MIFCHFQSERGSTANLWAEKILKNVSSGGLPVGGKHGSVGIGQGETVSHSFSREEKGQLRERKEVPIMRGSGMHSTEEEKGKREISAGKAWYSIQEVVEDAERTLHIRRRMLPREGFHKGFARGVGKKITFAQRRGGGVLGNMTDFTGKGGRNLSGREVEK